MNASCQLFVYGLILTPVQVNLLKKKNTLKMQFIHTDFYILLIFYHEHH